MELRVLGPVQLHADGRTIGIGAAKQRGLLALLVLKRDRPVSSEWLIDQLWEEDPPQTVKTTLQSCVYRLRKLLSSVAAPIELLKRSGGYQVQIPSGLLDLDRFDQAVTEGRNALWARNYRAAAFAYRAGLLQWRGEAFENVDLRLVRDAAGQLRERWLDAIESCLVAELATGQYSSVASELEPLVRQYPLRESLWQLRMLALARGGHTADALELYRELYQLLDEELGIEPSPPIRELRQRIADHELPGETETLVTVGTEGVRGAAATPANAVVPRMLPVAIDGFSGRKQDLARLDALVRSGAAAAPTVVISAISGMAGIGKTMLAVHWARRLEDQFPDGQLYVDLRGFHPSGRPTPSGEALRVFLDALGVPAERIPADLDMRSSLYRSMLAGMRVLVVLDNARDAGQVRPLLPGTPGSAVVVTSRNLLTGLVSADAALPLLLDLMTFDEARELLTWRLGQDRIEAEPQAVEAIIDACGRLPLALVIVAARAAVHPDFPLRVLAEELAEAGNALDALSDPGTDSGIDVRAVFSWSYRQLSPQAAQLFRLHGQHHGPDISVPAAASLAGLPLARVRLLLTELTGMHLLTEHQPGRYTCHDLLRVYASELAGTGPELEGAQAQRRILDHYLQTACAAAMLIAPNRDRIQIDPPIWGVMPEPLGDYDQAMGWLDTERRVLLAVIEQAAATGGFDAQVWRLAWALPDFLVRRGHKHDRIVVQRLALSAAERLGEPAVLADVHVDLAKAYSSIGQIDEAMPHLRDALQLYQAVRDVAGEAHTRYTIAFSMQTQGRYAESLAHALYAVKQFSGVGNKRGQSSALNGAAWCYVQLGEYTQALRYCEAALALNNELEHVSGQAATLDTLGHTHGRMGNYTEAGRRYQQAIERYRGLRDRNGEADALTHLGDNQLAAGDLEAARKSWQRALAIWQEFDQTAAALVRAKLEGLGSSPSGQA